MFSSRERNRSSVPDNNTLRDVFIGASPPLQETENDALTQKGISLKPFPILQSCEDGRPELCKIDYFSPKGTSSKSTVSGLFTDDGVSVPCVVTAPLSPGVILSQLAVIGSGISKTVLRMDFHIDHSQHGTSHIRLRGQKSA